MRHFIKIFSILLTIAAMQIAPVAAFMSLPAASAALTKYSITATSPTIQSQKTKKQVVSLKRALTKEEQKAFEATYDLQFARTDRKGTKVVVVPGDDSKFSQFLQQDVVEGTYNYQTYKVSSQSIEWGTTYTGAALAHSNSPAITGNNMVVAVIDTGVQLNHPDLVGVIKPGGYDYINNDSDPSDDNGHGTNIAGIIAANNNSINTVGIAYGVKILPFKVCDASGSCDSLAIADAIDDATSQHVDVINMSLGGSPNELVQAAVNRATAAGIIVVASAGNEGTASCDYPAAYSNVVCVGAIDVNGQRPSFSNYGTGLDVVAPGVDIKSLWIGSTTATVSGTSMSAAYYSGIAALIRGIQKDICTATPSASMCSDIRSYVQFLINNILVRDLGAYGYDSQFGTGAIDISRLFLNISVVYSNFPSNVVQGTSYLQTVNITNNNSFDMSLKSCKVRGDNLNLTQTQPIWTTGWLVTSGASWNRTSADLFESNYTMSTPYTITTGSTVRFDYSVTPSSENRNGDKIEYYFTCSFDNLATSETESYIITPTLNTTTVQQPDPIDLVSFHFNTLHENQTVPASQLNNYDLLTFTNFDSTKMRLIGIYTLDYTANDLRGAIYTKKTNTTYNVKSGYQLPSGRKFAYVATVQNIATSRYAYIFFVFYTQ